MHSSRFQPLPLSNIHIHPSQLSFPPYSLHLTLFLMLCSSAQLRLRGEQDCSSVAASARVCVTLREDWCWYEKHEDYRSAHKCFTLQPHDECIASGFKSRLYSPSFHLSPSFCPSSLSSLVAVDWRSLECHCRLRSVSSTNAWPERNRDCDTPLKCFMRSHILLFGEFCIHYVHINKSYSWNTSRINFCVKIFM